MLYFSDRSIPPSKLNRDQHQKLEEFKRWCQENGIYGTFRTVTQLKTSLSNHLTRTLRDLRNVDVASPQDDEERLRRLEVMAIDNARSESIRDMAGDSPVDASFLRQDMSRKACLSFLTGGSSLHGDTMTLPFRLRNEGQHPAYDVDVSVDSDQGPVMTNAKALEISSYKEHSFSFSIPRPPREDPPPDRLWTFTVRVRFRDGLGSDEAAFVFTFGGRDPYFNQHEDVERAQLSRLCRYVRPRE